jgi:hypothetical protein
LLLFYASNGIGKQFKATKKRTSAVTGIRENKIYYVRDNLRKLSVIDYECSENGHYIFVNWTVIYSYADLAEPLTVGGKARRNFVQEPQHRYINHPARIQDEETIISNLYSDNCFDYLANLTDGEYKYVRSFVLHELR